MNQLVNTEYGQLTFRANKRQVQKPTDPLYFSLMPAKKVTTDLLEGLIATASTKLTSILNLKIRNTDPLLGEDILTKLIEEYNKASLEDKTKLAATTSAFVGEKLRS
jgi:hypothetical protein